MPSQTDSGRRHGKLNTNMRLRHSQGSTDNKPILHECYTVSESLHSQINPLNTELKPICNLLALLGAHPILHISRIRVKCEVGQERNFINVRTSDFHREL